MTAELDPKALEAAHEFKLPGHPVLIRDFIDRETLGLAITAYLAALPSPAAGEVVEKLRAHVDAYETTGNGNMRIVSAMSEAADLIVSLEARIRELESKQ